MTTAHVYYAYDDHDPHLSARYPIPTPTTIPTHHPVSHTRLGSTPCSWVKAKGGGWEVGRRVGSLVDEFLDIATGKTEAVATVAARDGRTQHVRIGRCTGIIPGTSISRYARA